MKRKIILAGVALAAVALTLFSYLQNKPSRRFNFPPYDGSYTFQDVDGGRYMWIHTKEHIMIALDGIEDPRIPNGASDADIAALHKSYVEAIRALMKSHGNQFSFTSTTSLAGLSQAKGFIYFKDGSTLQEALIARGLARFARSEDFRELPPTIGYQALFARWLRADEKARALQNGYWQEHAESMRYYWDALDKTSAR